MPVFIKYLTHNQFLAVLLLVAVGWFLFAIKDILISFFLAFIIMAALRPLVLFLKRKGVPTALAIAIPYISTILLIVLIVFPLVPFFIAQVNGLLSKLPLYLEKASTTLNLNLDNSQIDDAVSREFASIGKNALAFTTRIFGGIFSILTIFVMSFYLMASHTTVVSWVSKLFSKNFQPKVPLIFDHVEEKLGAWLRGQILLCLFIGILSWIALTVLGIDYALPLAVIAGILEIIPIIGPIIAAIPAVIVAINISPFMVLAVSGAYFFIQFLENNVLVPKIMERAVGLNPLVIILSVIIGGELLGVRGALLSVPFISMIIIVISSIYKVHKSS